MGFNLREEVAKVCEVFDDIQAQGIRVDFLPEDIPYNSIFRMDLANYLMFLSISDGKIIPAEIEYINGLVGADFDGPSMISHIKKNNLASSAVIKKAPMSLGVAAFTDLSGITNNFGKKIVELFKACGVHFLQIDGEVTEEEKKYINAYIEGLVDNANAIYNSNQNAGNNTSSDKVTVEAVAELYSLLRNMFKSIGDNMDIQIEGESIDVEKAFVLDLYNYALFLSAGDSTLTKEEYGIICAVLGGDDVDPEALIRDAKEKNIVSQQFIDFNPYSFIVAVNIDKSKQDNKLISTLIDLYFKLGVLLIESDGRVTEQEKKLLDVYISQRIAWAKNVLG